MPKPIGEGLNGYPLLIGSSRWHNGYSLRWLASQLRQSRTRLLCGVAEG